MQTLTLVIDLLSNPNQRKLKSVEHTVLLYDVFSLHLNHKIV